MDILLPPSEALRTGIEAAIENPPGNDERIRALGHGLLHVYAIDPEIGETINKSLATRETMVPAYAFGLVRIAFQEQILHEVQHDPDSKRNTYMLRNNMDPFDGYDQPETWATTIQEFLQPDNPRRADIQHRLEHATVATTVTRRYILPQIIASLLQPRIGDTPSVLDIGSSKPIGIIRMALSGQLNGESANFMPQLSVNFVRPHDDDPKQYIPDPRNEQLQRVYAHTPKISLGVAGDIMSVDEEPAERWVRSSFYPKEYATTAGHRNGGLTVVEETSPSEYELLIQAKPPNIHVYQADFTKLNHKKFREFLQGISPTVAKEGFDFVDALTMTYELTPPKRQRVIRTAGRLTSRRGVVVLQDWLTQDSNDPHTFNAEATSFGEQFKYRTWIIDPHKPEQKPHELFVSRNGRVQDVMLGKDFEEFCDVYGVNLDAL
jgi:hypothetical protein